MKRTPALTILFVALAGCARIPRPHGPELVRTHPGLRQQLSIDTARPRRFQRAWWTALRAPALDRLIARSLATNPSLQQATARVRAAQANVLLHRAALLPHWNAQAGITAEHFSLHGLHTTANGTSVLYTAISPFIVHYHLTGFGRDRDQVEAAGERLQAARADQEEAALVLTTAIVTRYLAAEGAAAAIQYGRRLVVVSRSLLKVERTRFRSGLTDQTHVYVAQERLATAREALSQSRGALAIEEQTLSQLVGSGPAYIRKITLGPLPHKKLLPLPRYVPLRLVADRPDVRAARWLVMAAAHEIHAARAAFYPNVNLALLAGWNSVNLGNLLSPVNVARAVGPVVSLPVFEGRALRAHLSAQRAGFLAARDEYQETLLTAVREVANAITNWTQNRQELRAAQGALRAADRQQRLAARAFAAGLTNRLPLLAAHTAVLHQSLHLVLLRQIRGQIWARLEEAVDGGYRTAGEGGESDTKG